MELNIQEIYLPLILIILFDGCQIAGYFIYYYFKYKPSNVGLNKILLAYGLLYGFGLVGLVLRIINYYYLEVTIMKLVIIYMSHILIAIGVLCFQIIISSKSFNIIVNVWISRIILVLAIILSVLIFIFQTDYIISVSLIILSIIPGIVYMSYFHAKLITIVTGNMKKRLIFIIIGEFLLVIIVLFGAEEFSEFYPFGFQDIINTIYIPLILISLCVIFFGIFRFPIILEMEWKKNLIQVSIINRLDFNLLYNYKFESGLEDPTSKISTQSDKNEFLFSRGIIGINTIFKSISQSEDGLIEKIKEKNYIILIKAGEGEYSSLIYMLQIKSELKSMNYFFNLIIEKFQELYRDLIVNLSKIQGNEEKLFSTFDQVLKDILTEI